MKAYYLLVPLCAAFLGGCAYYTTAPAPVAYIAPAPSCSRRSHQGMPRTMEQVGNTLS